MQTKSRRWSDFTSGLGFAAFLFGGYELSYGNGPGWLAWLSFIVGFALMFAGFWFYIHAKGYNPAWAFLTFILGPVVFFVFFFLPDRMGKNAAAR